MQNDTLFRTKAVTLPFRTCCSFTRDVDGGGAGAKNWRELDILTYSVGGKQEIGHKL